MCRVRALICLLALSSVSMAQVVNVTLTVDTNDIPVGGSTMLRAFAQIAPAQRANADRIFSWYIDLLDSNSTAARAEYGQLAKVSSDNDPATSSAGTTVDFQRRGIYDTFLNLPGAGKLTPVELFRMPITGVSTGRVTFQLQGGTTVPNLSKDFIVAPLSGGDPLLGGDYSSATVQLSVHAAGGSGLRLAIAQPAAGKLALNFPVVSGRNYTVEYRNSLSAAGSWQALPGAPHNTGAVTVTNNAAQIFFRVRID